MYLAQVYVNFQLQRQIHIPVVQKNEGSYTIFKTLQYIHNTLCALRPLFHHHIYTIQNPCIYVCSAYVIMCVYTCVCTYVCVASQSPLFHNVYLFNLFFKSNFTTCISYLMWNRVPCSHGSM